MRGVYERAILKLGREQIYPRGRPINPQGLVRRVPILNKKTPVASIGSCFAANVKKYLVQNGYNYVQTSDAPGSEIGSAAWGTVYNTFCLSQEALRANGWFQPAEKAWADGKGGLLDPYRKNVGWRNRKHADSERERHAEDARRAFSEARVVIATAGLTEIWFAREDEAVFFQVPPARVFDEIRHAFAVSTLEENTANLRTFIRSIRLLSPDCAIILTVSPVPLRATFRDMSVIIANAQSKATLVSAVHAVVNPDNGVHYFPSYELVTVVAEKPFKKDNRHVRPKVIERAMSIFERSFSQDG